MGPVGVNSRQGSGEAGNQSARSIQLDNQATLSARAALVDGEYNAAGRTYCWPQAATVDARHAGGDAAAILRLTPIRRPPENSDIVANAFQRGTSPNHSQGILGWSHSAQARTQTLLGTETPSELDPSRLPSSDITVISQTDPSLSGYSDVSTRWMLTLGVGQLASRAN